jgi:long-chain fatty acid transport protein
MKLSVRKTGMVATVAAAFAAASGGAGAAGFALIEQSGSGMGNSFAGAAAVAEDASTVYFNPAGMSYLEGSQAAVAAHVIGLSSKFSGTATNPAALGGGTASGGNGGDAGDTAFVPNLYLVKPFGEQLRFGLGLNAPFGLTTEYDSNWVGRFQGIKSELTAVNVNPSVSYKVSDAFSIGVGVNYQRADAELTNAVVLGPGASGRTSLEADDAAWGWNIGAIFQVTPATRIGVAYRSEIDYTLEGSVSTTTSTGVVLPTAGGPSRADVTFPDSFSVSLAHAVSDRLQLLADVTSTGWSSINQVRVVNTTDGTLREVLSFDFDDTLRYSIGANYKRGDTWTLKAGLAFDETPVKNATTRTVRLPDNDRTWISLGAQRKVGRSGRLDLGYSHLFVQDTDINNTRSQQAPGFTTPTPAPGTATTVTGTYKASADIFSVQYTHNF